jgi:hypothetical protein
MIVARASMLVHAKLLTRLLAHFLVRIIAMSVQDFCTVVYGQAKLLTRPSIAVWTFVAPLLDIPD